MKLIQHAVLWTLAIAIIALTGLASTAAASVVVPVSETLETNWARRPGHVQGDVYHFEAAAGTLKLSVNFGGARSGPESVRMVIRDRISYQIVLSEDFTPLHTTATVSLPSAGSYAMVITPNHLSTLTLEAPELKVAERTTPAVSLRPMAAYESVSAPFSAGAALLIAGEAAALQIARDDQVLAANALGPDGTVTDVTIDPATLADGVYTLAATARSKGSDNYGYVYRTFLVDRVSAFSDLPAEHWARRYVEVMAHQEILRGQGDGRFAPDRAVTRAEFAKMLALTLNISPSDAAAFPFVDDAAAWARPHIQALFEAGLITGETVDGQAYFRPERTISRAEAAVIISRALGAAAWTGGGEPFPDWSEVPDWARPSVRYLHAQGWLGGMPDGRFQPRESLRRDQAAKLLAKFLGM